MEAAMGGASFNIDRDWESICGILSFDQDSDFSNLLAHNPHHQLPASDDNESLLDLLIQDTNPITSTFGQFHTHQTLPNPGSNTFPQLMSCSPTTTDDVSNNSSSSGSLHYLNDQDSCHFAQPYDNDDQFSAFIKGSSKANQFSSIQIQSHQIPLPKKRTRVSKEVGKGKRRTQPRKNKLKEAVGQETEEEDGKSSYEASDNDEESNDTQELEIQSLNGKKRASRGAATDPQSLYARKRRERINERLKILQTLVPNGTKVDISTMLEEAVNYVKFLQLQIKLLSSDEMWMYAPLAYNGFDVGHYNNFST